MADLVETTNLGPTGYTSYHNHASTTTWDVDSRLRVRSGPGTDYSTVGYIAPGSWWSVAERHSNGWCRQPSCDNWTSGDFMSNPWPGTPSPGEFRVDSIKVTATRANNYTKNLKLKYEWRWSNAGGTSETYYHWRVYCYAAKPGGGECQQNITGDSQNLGPDGSGSFSETFTVEETSGNTSITPGNYGICYTSWGGYINPNGGVGNPLTITIPKYIAGEKPTVVSLSTSSRETTSFNINATFSPNHIKITKSQFGYRTGTGAWTDSDKTETSTETENNVSSSKSITNRTPNTKYEVRARAYNSVGWGDWKDSVYVWTKPFAAKPTIACTARGKTSVTVTVTKASTGNYPDINLYDVNYKISSNSSWTDLLNQSTGSFSKTGLDPNTEYKFKGRVRTGTGGDTTTAWSSWSDEITVKTKPSAGTASASCVRNRDLGKLNIKVNTSGTYSPKVDTYQIRYRKKGTTNWTEATASTSQTQTLSNLSQSQEYDIQVRARTSQGIDGSYDWSAWSSTYNVKTVSPSVITDIEQVENTTSSVTLRVSYTNKYPNANRIYYALVPTGSTIPTDPGRISNMYVSTTSSPTTFTVTKDYQGNNLSINKKYVAFIRVNQYKGNSDWYTAGLDLDSSSSLLVVSTSVNVGTMKNVKCVRNNTYNSLTLHAENNGTWTVYKGWGYRYKKSTDPSYGLYWSTYDKNDKIISNLEPGETYNIQIRGSTGNVSDELVYYSNIYELTVKVVRKPKMTLEVYHLRKDEIGIMGRITDPGYPQVSKLQWIYKSPSYITLSYVPNTEVIANTVTFGTTVNESHNYLFKGLHNTAKYDIIAALTHYKAPADWYTAGLDHRIDFEIKDIDLAMYNERTSRLKGYKSSWKKVNSLKSWDGTSWKDGGTNGNPTTKLPIKQVWGNIRKDNPNVVLGFKTNTQANKDKFNVWFPGVDPISFKGLTEQDNGYGGNLLPNKITIDFPSLISSGNVSFRTDRYNVQIKGNSFSMKLKTNGTIDNEILMSLVLHLPTNVQIDTVYVEYCQNIIPYGNDKADRSSLIGRYFLKGDEQNGDNHVRYIGYQTNQTRFIVAYPIYLYKDSGYTLEKLLFSNGTDNPSRSKMQNAGTIFNISNFNVYYTIL